MHMHTIVNDIIKANNITVSNTLSFINKLSLFIFVFCLSLPGTGNPMKIYTIGVFISSSFVYIIYEKSWKDYRFNKTHLFLLILPLFYLLGFIYYPWDEDVHQLFWVQERKLSLFFIPIIILLVGMRPFRLKTMCNILIAGCMFSIIYVLILQYITYGHFDYANFFDNFNFVRATQYSHHVPFNLLMNFSIASIIYFILNYKNNKIVNTIYVLSLIIISVVIFNTEGRVGLLSFLVLLPCSILYYLFRVSRNLGIIVFVICLLIGSYIFIHHPRISELNKENISTGDKVGQLPRIFIWEKSIEIIEDEPILGHGIGTTQNMLNKKYDAYNYKTGVENNFHSHNQILQSWTQFGIFGLIMVLYILIYPLYFFIKHNKNELILFLWILFFIANITEPLLQVAFGIYPFCFMLFVMYCDSAKNKSKI